MKRSVGPFLGGPGTRALILTAIATASIALTLTAGVYSFKPYDPEGPPDPVCPMGYEFSNGECVLVTPPTTCPDGYHMEGETCAPDVVPSCPDGFVYKGGECVAVEEPEPDAPYGAKGVGEPPTVVSTAAIVSALRNATGRELSRVPVRPDDLVGL